MTNDVNENYKLDFLIENNFFIRRQRNESFENEMNTKTQSLSSIVILESEKFD